MLDMCLTVLMGSLDVCVWEIGRGLPGLCIFLGNTSVVVTWAGSVIFFPINAPGMGRFKLFDLVGYS